MVSQLYIASLKPPFKTLKYTLKYIPPFKTLKYTPI